MFWRVSLLPYKKEGDFIFSLLSFSFSLLSLFYLPSLLPLLFICTAVSSCLVRERRNSALDFHIVLVSAGFSLECRSSALISSWPSKCFLNQRNCFFMLFELLLGWAWSKSSFFRGFWTWVFVGWSCSERFRVKYCVSTGLNRKKFELRFSTN